MDRWLVGCLVVALLSITAPKVAAEDTAERPFVSPIFGDNMVLQYGWSNRIWGWTTPGASVRVSMGQMVATGVADATGRWVVTVVPAKGSGECTLVVDGPSHAEFHHVVVGQVWMCCGPSSVTSRECDGDRDEAQKARVDHTKIRLLIVDGNRSSGRSGEWRICRSRADAVNAGICAIAYTMACREQIASREPIALVQDRDEGGWVDEWLGDPDRNRADDARESRGQVEE